MTMSFDLERLVIGELLLVTLIVLSIHARRTITRVLFQRRRRSHMSRATPSVFPVVSGLRGMPTKDAWEEFVNDEKLLRAYRITPRELESLKQGSMLGGVTCREDIVFLLKTIRGTSRRI
jgi:hypothetical protein